MKKRKKKRRKKRRRKGEEGGKKREENKPPLNLHPRSAIGLMRLKRRIQKGAYGRQRRHGEWLVEG
jgi:hypothetical protein